MTTGQVAPTVITTLVVGLALLMHFLPRWTRPDVYFAVTVAPSFRGTREAARILRRYRIEVWIHAIVATAVVVIVSLNGATLLLPVGVLYLVLGTTAALVRARAAVRPHATLPSQLREASLTPRRTQLPGGIVAAIGPFAMIVCVAVVLTVWWNHIPERFPVHWNAALQPDEWSARSVGTVFRPLVVGVLMCAILVLVAYGIARWSHRISIRGPRARLEERFLRVILGLILASAYALAFASTWQSLLPLRAEEPLPIAFFLPLGLMLTVIAIALITLVRIRREAYVIAAESLVHVAEPPVGDHTPDRCWKLGVLYFNREDPALFVEKRFGLGYTVNFGNVWSWVLLGVLIVLPLVIKVGITAIN